MVGSSVSYQENSDDADVSVALHFFTERENRERIERERERTRENRENERIVTSKSRYLHKSPKRKKLTKKKYEESERSTYMLLGLLFV